MNYTSTNGSAAYENASTAYLLSQEVYLKCLVEFEDSYLNLTAFIPILLERECALQAPEWAFGLCYWINMFWRFAVIYILYIPGYTYCFIARQFEQAFLSDVTIYYLLMRCIYWFNRFLWYPLYANVIVLLFVIVTERCVDVYDRIRVFRGVPVEDLPVPRVASRVYIFSRRWEQLFSVWVSFVNACKTRVWKFVSHGFQFEARALYLGCMISLCNALEFTKIELYRRRYTFRSTVYRWRYSRTSSVRGQELVVYDPDPGSTSMDLLKFLNIPPEFDYYFTQVLCFVIAFDNAKNAKGRAAACVSFMCGVTQKGVVGMVQASATVLQVVRFAVPGRQGLTATSGKNVEDSLEYYLDQLTNLESDPAYLSVVRIISILCGVGLFGTSHVGMFLVKHNVMDQTITKNAAMQRTDRVFVDVSRTFLELLKRIRSPESDGKSYVRTPAQLQQNIYLLTSNASNRTVTGESKTAMNHVEFTTRLRDCDNYIKEVLGTFPSPLILAAMKEPSAQVAGLCLKYRQHAMDNERDGPYCIGITGVPGTGKTEMGVHLAIRALRALGFRDATRTNIFFHNANLEFWDGYCPTKHWAVILDEVGSFTGKGSEQDNMKAFKGLLQMMSPSPILTAQAEAHNKASHPFLASVIVLMSNIHDFGAMSLLACPPAFYRRFHTYIHCDKVYDRYRNPRSFAIDAAKVPPGVINCVDIHVHAWSAAQKKLEPLCNGSEKIRFKLTDILLDVGIKAEKHAKQLKCDQARMAMRLEYLCPDHGVADCPVCSDLSTSDIAQLRATSGHYEDGEYIYDDTWGEMLHYKFWMTIYAVQYLALYGVFSALTGGALIGGIFARRYGTPYFKEQWDGGRWMIAGFRYASWGMFMDAAFPKRRSYVRMMEEAILSTRISIHKYRAALATLGGIAMLAGVYTAHMRYAKRDEEEPEKVPIPTPTGGVSGKLEKHTVTAETLGVEPPLSEARHNIWHHDEEYLPFGPSTCNGARLMDKVLENTYRMTKANGEFNHILCVYSEFFVLAKHFKLDRRVSIKKYQPLPDGCYEQEVFSGDIPTWCVSDLGFDTQVVRIPGMRPGVDLRPYLFKHKPTTSLRVNVVSSFHASDCDRGIGADRTPKLYRDEGTCVLASCTTMLPGAVALRGICWDAVMKFAAYDGRCGTSLVGMWNKQIVLLGVNVAGVVGKESNVYSPLYCEEIDTAISTLSKIATPTSGRCVSETLAEFGLRNVNPTRIHHMMYLHETPLMFQGVLERATSASMKSRIVIHPCTEDIRKVLKVDDILAAPIFKHTKIAGVYVSQESHALRDFSNYTRNVDVDKMFQARDEVVARWIDAAEPSSLRVYNLHTACNGHPDISLSGIRKNTGAGFPYPGKKGEYMEASPTRLHPDGRVVNEKIRTQMNDAIECWMSGRRTNEINVACFKDEARPLKKVENRQNRFFSAGGLSLLVVARMIFGPFLNVVAKHPTTFETIAGVNCFSKAWKLQFADVLHHPHVVNSDFKRYDKAIPALVTRLVFDAMIQCCRVWYADWNNEIEQIAVGIMTETCFPLYLMDSTIFECAGSNPSGSLFTLFENGAAQSIMHRYVYSRANVPAGLKFSDHVTLVTLGDDGSQSISEDVIDYYNFGVMVREYAALGITITDASKGEGAQLSTPAGSSVIGKRSIRVDESGIVMCPLDMSSIFKMMTTTLRQPPLSDSQRMALSFEAGIQEIAMYGKERYDACVPQFLVLAKKYGFSRHMTAVLTYEEVIDRFLGGRLAPQNPDVAGLLCPTGDNDIYEE